MSMRVHVLYETDRLGQPHGCSHIRLLRPLQHPSLADQLKVSHGTYLPDGVLDAVIVERYWRPDTTLEAIDELVAALRQRGIRLIYTLDDNLLDVERHQAWYATADSVQCHKVARFLRLADGVIVSTEALKQRCKKLNPRIAVVENALDEQLFLPADSHEPPQPWRNNERLTIGYMGTFSHLQDLMMVLEPLRTVLREAAGLVEFQIVGIAQEESLAACFDGLPFRVLDTGGKHFYPDFVAWARQNLCWDLAIAPLVDNAFTRCKSDIKFLDYSLLGIPGIYSQVEAYRQSVHHGETGWLCPNDPAAWIESLLHAIGHREQRGSISASAFKQVEESRMLRTCAGRWLCALDTFQVN